MSYNDRVIEKLAKKEVEWESQFGRTITLEQAKIKVKKKLDKLQKEDDFRY